jgi:hypothetical protein
LVHGNMKGVKRVEHCCSSIKFVDGLKFQFKSRDIPLSIPIGRNPRCCLFYSFLLNSELSESSMWDLVGTISTNNVHLYNEEGIMLLVFIHNIFILYCSCYITPVFGVQPGLTYLIQTVHYWGETNKTDNNVDFCRLECLKEYLCF